MPHPGRRPRSFVTETVLEDKHSFRQCLRHKLDKLEQELWQAHLETHQPFDESTWQQPFATATSSTWQRLSKLGVDTSSHDCRLQERELLDKVQTRKSVEIVEDIQDTDSEESRSNLRSKDLEASSPRRPRESLCKRPLGSLSCTEPKLPLKVKSILQGTGDDVLIETNDNKAETPHFGSSPDEQRVPNGNGKSLRGSASCKTDGTVVETSGTVCFETSLEEDSDLPSRVSRKARDSVESCFSVIDRDRKSTVRESTASRCPSMHFVAEVSEKSVNEGDTSVADTLPGLTLRPTWQYTQRSRENSRKSRRGRKTKFVKVLSENINKHKNGKGHVRASVLAKLEDADTYTCIIHPFSRIWLNWEIFGFALLVYDMVLVPMQVYQMPDHFALNFMKWLTMVYWTITLFLTFNVSFQQHSDSTFVTSHRTIITHYLKGWFIFDFFLVSSDWVGVIIDWMIAGDNSLENARMARMARLGRLFRFIRLLRIMRIGEMLQRVRSLINSEYISICFLLACNVVTILVLAHLAACVWFGIGSANEGSSWLVPLFLDNADVGDQYIQSLGWSLSTLLGTTVTRAFPESTVEHSCALVILVIGTIAVSLVFSSTTAAMTRLQQLRSEEREATFKLKKFLRQNNISGSLEARVTRYVDIAKSVHSNRIPSDKVGLLDLLSGPLRLELQLELHAPHLTQHQFFELYHVTSPGAMSELCLTAVGFVYLSRYDSLFSTFSQANRMYFLVSGVLAYRRAKGAKNTPQTVKVDKHCNFSEAAIWTCWVHRGGMKAIIESQVLALDAAAFCEITEAHHDVFLQACEYACDYLEELNQRIWEKKYVWDVPSELMYPDEHMAHTNSGQRVGPQRSSMFEQHSHLHVLKEAEQVSAELMNLQDDSDSDSEDERLLKSALARGPSMYVRQNSMARDRDSGASTGSTGFDGHVARFAA